MKSFLALLFLLALLIQARAEEQQWSETVNGLRARLSVERDKDSPFVKVFLEIQNTSDVLGFRTIRFKRDAITPTVTTAAGKSLLKANGDYDGFSPYDGFSRNWTPLKLPIDGTLRFRISFPGLGYNPKVDKTIVDLGPHDSWSVPGGEAWFLSAKLKIDKEEGDPARMDWSGTLSLPKVLISQK